MEQRVSLITVAVDDLAAAGRFRWRGHLEYGDES